MASLSDPATYLPDMENLWKKIKHRTKKSRDLAMLRELAKWREQVAQEKNLPRGRVLKDETLVEIAHNTPESESALRRVRGFGNQLSARRVASLLDSIAQAAALPKESWPKLPKRTPLPEAMEGAADLLRMLLKRQCALHKVTPRLVADRQEIETLLREGKDADLPMLKGWRREVFGQQALDLLAGNIGFAVDPATHALVIKE